MILFLSHFPTSETIKDGMSQRISNIDEYFDLDERIYLNVFFGKFLRKKIIKENEKTILNCNLFLHFFLIYKLFNKAEKVYIHSIYYSLKSLFFISHIKNDYILDLHGVVPEENLLVGNRFQYYLYNYCEKIAFENSKNVICVTESMKNYYKSKYPTFNVNYIIFPILPNTIKENYEIPIYKDSSSLINIVYSGNTQKWQNIGLMSDIIKKNLTPNIKYYILTGNITDMKEQLDKKIFSTNNQIEILSVNPKELKAFYEKCHYGFILRDDIIVNNVSCPTKLIEYLYYGITPIVLSSNIGDFKQLGYEFVNYDQQLNKLLPIKSKINNQIIKQLVFSKININFRELIFS